MIEQQKNIFKIARFMPELNTLNGFLYINTYNRKTNIVTSEYHGKGHLFEAEILTKAIKLPLIAMVADVSYGIKD